MAYGLLYELLATSVMGNLDKVRISKDAYAGVDIERNVPINPFRIRKLDGEVINGTVLEFVMREANDFEFIPMFSQPLKHYLVEAYRSTTLLWKGYLNTQQYEAEYRPAPVNVAFMAYDGLALLKDEEFDLTGNQDEFTILRHCIDKIGLGIGYAIAISLHEENHNVSLSPLEQTFQHCKIYEDNDCYEVIEKILSRYDATITQVLGRWEILSSKDKASTRLLYDEEGVYETTQEAPTVLDLGYPGTGMEVYPVGRLTHRLLFGGRKIRVTHNYGRRESFLRNYDFAAWDPDTLLFDDWTKGGTMTTSQHIKDEEYYAWISGYANVDTDYLERAEDVINVSGDAFAFSINFCPVGYTVSSGGISSINMEVRVQVTCLVGATTYYLSTSGWSTTPGYITATVSSATFRSEIVWTNIKILTDGLPGDGTVKVRLMRYKNTAPGASTFYTAVAFQKPLIYFLDDGELYDDEIDVVATFDNSSELAVLEDLDFSAADAPDVDNKSLLYDNITRLSDGTPTLNWNMDGYSTDFTLLQLCLKLIASRNRRPLEALTGRLKGDDVRFNSIIKHTYNSSRQFEVVEGVWNLYEEVFDCTIREIPEYSEQAITLDDNSSISYSADLTVTAITPEKTTGSPAEEIEFTVRVTNSGDIGASGTVQWKITDGDDVEISSGTAATGDIAASAYSDFIITANLPGSTGTYYFKAKITNDTTWVVTDALTCASGITVDSIDAIADGAVGSPLNVSYDYTNPGSGGSYTLYWQLVDGGTILESGTKLVTLYSGTRKGLTSLTNYPATNLGLSIKLCFAETGTYTESDTFDSLVVDFNHIDTIADQTYGAAFSSITFEATAASAIAVTVYWRVRDSSHAVKASGSNTFNMSSGTATYTLTGTMPEESGPDPSNFDLQIGRRSTYFELTSNHFDMLEA